MATTTILNYSSVRTMVKPKPNSTTHLLLGNGFSIACDPCFKYPSLFEHAKKNGLSDQVIGVFGRLGTNNFEGVMRLLEDGEWLANHYGFLDDGESSEMLADLQAVKAALIRAVAETHPADTGKVADSKKSCCVRFLESYHNIFTTNYDLLAYWVEMHGHSTLQKRDGFRQAEDGGDDDYVVFSERLGGFPGIYFVHGALHLYVKGGEVRKHCWSRTGKALIQNIKDGLDKGQYPLFVAEGNAEKKLEQIQRSGYLSYCLGKLERIENDLVVFGLSFGDSDQHICDVIARNRKLKRMFVGLIGGLSSQTSLDTRRNIARIIDHRKTLKSHDSKVPDLEVHFYKCETCPVWSTVA